MKEINKKVIKYIILFLIVPAIIGLFLSLTNLKNQSTYSDSIEIDKNGHVTSEVTAPTINNNKFISTLYISSVGLVVIGTAMYIFLYKKKEW